MCKLVVMNRIMLGAREQCYECWSLPKGELVEKTAKQLSDLISTGKSKVYGMILNEEGELVLDKAGFCTNNMMEKRHTDSFIPMVEMEGLAVNNFIVVLGKNANGTFETISNRYLKSSIDEEKLKFYYELGMISGGAVYNKETGHMEIAPDNDIMVSKPEKVKKVPKTEDKKPTEELKK